MLKQAGKVDFTSEEEDSKVVTSYYELLILRSSISTHVKVRVSGRSITRYADTCAT